jgi:hypothetical protein
MKHLSIPQLDSVAMTRFSENFPIGKIYSECGSVKRKERPETIFQIGNKKYAATRICYFVAYEKDPGYLLVCHECDCASPLAWHNYDDFLLKGGMNPVTRHVLTDRERSILASRLKVSQLKHNGPGIDWKSWNTRIGWGLGSFVQ